MKNWATSTPADARPTSATALQPSLTATYSTSHPASAAANAATGSFCHWLALLPIHRATTTTTGFSSAASSTALSATGSMTGMVDLFAGNVGPSVIQIE